MTYYWSRGYKVKKLKIPTENTRTTILKHLLDKDLSAIDLSGKLGINESGIRRHLNILEERGYIRHYFKKSNRKPLFLEKRKNVVTEYCLSSKKIERFYSWDPTSQDRSFYLYLSAKAPSFRAGILKDLRGDEEA